MAKLFSTIVFLLFVQGLNSCVPRYYGYSSFVCVCNRTYCDTFKSVSAPSVGKAYLYESVRNESLFVQSVLTFSSSPTSGDVFHVNQSTKYQFVVGFGGAFTDSTGINIASLPSILQKQIISSYFASNGLEYSMGRVPMAGCDFSTRPYSYDDIDGDFNLTHFQLAKEDLKYKIPYIKMAQSMSQHELLLFASPWSAPAWMKTNNKVNGAGQLKGKPGDQYYQTWADYFVRFLKEYAANNVSFWGVTAQNEPTTGFVVNYSVPSMGFTPEMQRDFLKMNLGPTLKKAGYGIENLKLMILDDDRLMLPKWADMVMSDPSVAEYVSGIAIHFYLNYVTPSTILDVTHEKHPDLFLLSTEACTGYMPWDIPKVQLGNWERAETYAHDIIQNLQHWSVGWVDWNMALDVTGGPNWVNNFVDAPIIVNKTSEEFYKQPMYYAIAHFSKLLPPGSMAIDIYSENSKAFHLVDIAAFQTPQDETVVIVVNRGDTDIHFNIRDNEFGYLSISSPQHSIQSYIWSTCEEPYCSRT